MCYGCFGLQSVDFTWVKRIIKKLMVQLGEVKKDGKGQKAMQISNRVVDLKQFVEYILQRAFHSF